MSGNVDTTKEVAMTTAAEARAYYALLDEARKLGIPTSLDDPRSPRTIEAIRVAVATMK